PLVACGAAGARHAGDLADEMGIRTVIVPTLCGNLSALGLLVSDARHDLVQTYGRLATESQPEDLSRRFGDLEKQILERLSRYGFPPDRIEVLWTVDARDRGPSYELTVPVAPPLDLAAL